VINFYDVPSSVGFREMLCWGRGGGVARSSVSRMGDAFSCVVLAFPVSFWVCLLLLSFILPVLFSFSPLSVRLLPTSFFFARWRLRASCVWVGQLGSLCTFWLDAFCLSLLSVRPCLS